MIITRVFSQYSTKTTTTKSIDRYRYSPNANFEQMYTHEYMYMSMIYDLITHVSSFPMNVTVYQDTKTIVKSNNKTSIYLILRTISATKFDLVENREKNIKDTVHNSHLYIQLFALFSI